MGTMLENKFEKQVQLKMKEFVLHPSEEVWMEVERRIREGKKRRFFFWWPLLFLLVAGGIVAGILFTNKKEKAGKVTANSNVENKFQSPSEKTIVPKPAQTLTSTDTRDIPGSGNDTAMIKEDNSESKIISGNAGETLLPGNKPAVKEPVMIKKLKVNNPVITKEDIVITEKQKKDQDKQPAVTIFVPLKPADDLPDSTKANDIAVVEKKDLQQKKQQEPGLKITDSIKTNLNNKPAVTRHVFRKPGIDFPDSTAVNDNAVAEKKDLQQENLQEPAPQTADSIKKEKKIKPKGKKRIKLYFQIKMGPGSRNSPGKNGN
jgi:hypothetical protein